MAGKKKPNQDLVDMSVSAGNQHRTYGELQKQETMRKMKEESMMLTAKDKLELAQYRRIGSVAMFKAAKEKLTTITVDAHQTGEGYIMDCPGCGRTFQCEDWDGINYCMHCGQAIKVVMKDE